MTLPRVESVAFVILREREESFIEARFEGGKTLQFNANQMLHQMKKRRMMRLKVAVIEDMAYKEAIEATEDSIDTVQALLNEFQLAAEEFGVRSF